MRAGDRVVQRSKLVAILASQHSESAKPRLPKQLDHEPAEAGLKVVSSTSSFGGFSLRIARSGGFFLYIPAP